MSSDLGMRRRRAVWRASHRGTKEMDYLLGQFAEQSVDSMNSEEISVLERLIEMQDPEIELSVYEGYSLGDRDLDTLVSLIREFHGLPGSRQ
ncbi:succinate dehydrogenase assembly factor 2 [Methyloceanibacter sp.]|uniref:FAD assembly factor SdhE n=1 Tax=Methyloceanibacter sp. TaxID=1965321 RepID=UPI002D1D4AED|nr:succinate dehydrogenase assembly factor 2 [Methyloceanibacter sp.]HML93430.1 succinate dehydrogenase assembly factor 2 [Methyloceanibacter sp.]